VQSCGERCGCVVLRRCGNIYELCARSSAGSERLATNQKVGSSNLSGRTCDIQIKKETPRVSPFSSDNRLTLETI